MVDDSDSRIRTGAAWREFLELLGRAGEVILRGEVPDDAFERAEGYRYLTRLVRVALESNLEFGDPYFPILRRPAHETVKIGADNPDNYYQSAAITGACEYRIRGRRNSVHYLGFGTYAGSYGGDGRMGQTGYLEGAALEIAPDGSFEIALSTQRRPGNWLPMEPDTSSLIVRQTFRSRSTEQVADLAIERVGGATAPEPISADFVDRGLVGAGRYVLGTAALFADWSAGFAKQVNALPRFDPAVARAAHGDPNIVYYHGYWELEPDEALVIEVTPPVCEYWNFQVDNYWMESLDYRYHRIAINHSEAELEADGSVRIVLAHRDPRLPNWLETAGHRRGTMCLRWVRAETHPDPRTRVLRLEATA